MEQEPVYVTREDVQRALDVATTARTAVRIDACVAAASRDVDGLTRRRFYPWTGTRYFDWPNRRSGTSWRLWLDANELAELDTLTSGGEVLTDWYLEPNGQGPPYNQIQINRGGSGSFISGDSEQRAVAATGTYIGCPLREYIAGTLAAGINASVTSLTVSDASLVGIGSILRVGDERLQVTGKQAATTGTTLSGNIAAGAGVVTVPVASGAAVHAGEVVLVDAERMLVTDVAGNNLVVKRAWDGTVLAAHTTGATVYAYRACTVTRGDLGTTAAAHNSADAIAAHLAPPLVRELTTAYALVALEQGSASYGRIVGSGESQREAAGRGVRAIEDDVARLHQRRGRIRSV